MRVLAAIVFASTLIGSACADRSEAPDRAVGDSTIVTPADATPAPAVPDRIYYDLTRYEWYARGEPLRHDGRSYEPGPDPIEAAADSMRRVGEYAGVDVYARDGAPADSIVYVPVFERFWQPFVATSDTLTGPDTTSVAWRLRRGGPERTRRTSGSNAIL